MTVAQEILKQLGGNRFVAMTGAKNFVASHDALTFRLPSNFAAKGINIVRVTLDANDTYTVQFYKARGVDVAEIEKCTDVYFDFLQELFSDRTGLAVRL
jgi:hypothetical protein